MDLAGLERLRLQLKSAQSVSRKKVDDILNCCWEENLSENITLAFYLTRCNSDGFRQDELISFMCDQLVTYVLSREEYEKIEADEIRKVFIAAKETFLRSKGPSGEAGELLLYMLLESRGIVQLYSKMDLKTARDMPYHGFDAIHLQVGKSVIFHFGHAKTHASFASGLSSALDDIEEFNKDKQQKRRELRLVSRHLDKVKFGDAANDIIELISPYTKHKEHYGEASSVFIGAEWSFAIDPTPTKGPDLDKTMVELYRKEASEIAKKVTAAIETRPDTRGLTFLFLILPIPNVSNFRREFMETLNS